ncbi:MAG: class IV adenylate cyclase [Rickettsiales bacterium]|jgi:adenylate cyclase class 2|nr:class IV adenylate cyclase [Rickettsiales bacterium]
MKTEFECRFIGIDINDLRTRLTDARFTLAEPERLMKRKIFFLSPKDGAMRWFRLRDQGDKTTLTLKSKGDISQGISSMKEIECDVGDFETMAELLAESGLKLNSFEENRREKWTKDGAEVCLDTWPGLKTFAEIEAASEQMVKLAAAELGFDWSDAMFGNVMEVYGKELGIGMDKVHGNCTFDNPPKAK